MANPMNGNHGNESNAPPDGGTDAMISLISTKVPTASRQVILELLVSCGANVKEVLSLLGVEGTEEAQEYSRYQEEPRMLTSSSIGSNNEESLKESDIAVSLTTIPTSSDISLSDSTYQSAGYQTTLKRFFIADNSDRERKRHEKLQQESLIGEDWKDSDLESDEAESSSPPPIATVGGLPSSNRKFVPPSSGVLHLYDPDTIEELLPCTFHLNVFPKKLANDLLRFFVEESKTWTRRKFYLFDRLVVSPHSSGMYSNNEALLKTQSATYQGSVVSGIRPFNDLLTEAGNIVIKIVNEQISRRGYTNLQYKGKWTSDVVVTNCYDGGQESVGYHSDQLTHLGPACVIASISLGVTREFRLAKRWSPAAKREHKQASLASIDGYDDTKFSIHVSHNSMVIMHAGSQEAYKHCVMPSKKPLSPHPISDLKRINLTYRMFLPEYVTEKLPRCSCDKPMILRTAKTEWPKDMKMPTYKYVWQCSAEYSTNKGCGKIVYLDWVP